jgi:hypothetical protein
VTPDVAGAAGDEHNTILLTALATTPGDHGDVFLARDGVDVSCLASVFRVMTLLDLFYSAPRSGRRETPFADDDRDRGTEGGAGLSITP